MALVVANMIGTGVFTSLGYQLASAENTYSILLLWVIGGLLSLFGAFTYAELGTTFNESGGEYIFLSRIFHPLLGYLTAWASLIVGFSAPVALAAIAMTDYLQPFNVPYGSSLAIGIILLTGLFHSLSLKQSSNFHNLFTILKISFLLVLIGIGLYYAPYNEAALNFSKGWLSEVTRPGYAVSLVFVTYAYTGWNASAYIVEEIDDVKRSLPRALILGTLTVTVFYVFVQYILLRHASVNELVGKVQVATIAFDNVLGSGGRYVSLFIALQLIATISGYVWIGPRVTYSMAREFRLWKVLRKTNANNIPQRALWLHVAISIFFVLTGTFEQVLLYTGFVLQLMNTLTVVAALFNKRRSEAGFKSPLFPVLQLVYILFSLWILTFMLYDRPVESLIGLGIIGVGAVTYWINSKL